MSEDDTSGETLPPDDAFAALGNETRVDILRVLGEHGDPLPFSELYDEIDLRDSGQFNYHLEKLVGHFVRKTEEGYALERAGRRVVEAILSGAVTDDTSLEPTVIDENCDICGAPVEVSWQDGSVDLFCTECDGRYGSRDESDKNGYLGRLPLPPAGLRNRSAHEVARTAWIWTNVEIMAMASGICPRCSAPIDSQRSVCDDHDTTSGLCSECHGYYEVGVRFTCTNCIYESGGAAVLALLSNTHLLDFLTDNGYNPIEPDSFRRVSELQMDYDESVRSRDPFRAQFAFTADGDTLALTVDETLSVVDTTRER